MIPGKAQNFDLVKKSRVEEAEFCAIITSPESFVPMGGELQAMSHAILIAGHGSRDPEGIAEFLDLARRFRAHQPGTPVEVAFLEFARPTIQQSIDRLAADGARQIVVLPGVLMAAGHAKNDMASEVRRAREHYPDLDIRMGQALDVDPLLLQLCRLRYE